MSVPVMERGPNGRPFTIKQALGAFIVVAALACLLFTNFSAPVLTDIYTDFDSSSKVGEMSPKQLFRVFRDMASSDIDLRQEESALSLSKRLHKAGWSLVSVYNGNKPPPAKRWTAQVGQDKTVVDIFNGSRGGFFLDLAANDAEDISNSLTLEQDYDWDGICVEANPMYAPGFYPRRCQLVQAVAGAENNENVTFNFRGAMGGIVGDQFDNKGDDQPHNYLTVTLGKVLDDLGAPRVIDYFSLDIEGAEWYVMKNFPWDKYTFLVLTVERPQVELQEAFRAHGYTYMCDHANFGDQMWIHKSLPNFEEVKKKYQYHEATWDENNCGPAREGTVLKSFQEAARAKMAQQNQQ